MYWLFVWTTMQHTSFSHSAIHRLPCNAILRAKMKYSMYCLRPFDVLYYVQSMVIKTRWTFPDPYNVSFGFAQVGIDKMDRWNDKYSAVFENEKKKNGNKLIRKMYVKHKTGLDIGTFECSSRWMLFELWIAESAGCAVMLWYAETWVHLQCVFKYVHYTCNYDTVWSACIWVTQQTCMLHMCEYPLWMHLHKIVCLCVCVCVWAGAKEPKQMICANLVADKRCNRKLVLRQSGQPDKYNWIYVNTNDEILFWNVTRVQQKSPALHSLSVCSAHN